MTIKPARGLDFPVTVPVLVIGSGACGLTAALAAHDAGAAVLGMHATPKRTGGDLMGYLLAAAEAADVPIMASAHVVALFAEGDGRIAGVEVARPDGATEMIGCAALVLACNGYGGDQALVR